MNRQFWLLIILVCTCVSLNSCLKQIKNQTGPKEYTFYPAPPDSPRIQFLLSINNSFDLEKKQSSLNKFVFGESKPKSLIKPYGVTIHNGKIYLCDTGMKGIAILDLTENKFDFFIPEGQGRLVMPISCFVDSKGNLYVADGGRKEIVIFNNDGKFIGACGEKENFKPTDVFVKNDKIWVANIKNHAIDVYQNDSTFQLISSFPEAENNSDGYLNQPTNLYVTDDKVYVTDFGSFKVKIYNQNGEFEESFGSYGNSFGQFVRPKGIALDKELNRYVVDAAFENVQIFNKNNELLMFFGGGSKSPGGMSLPAKVYIDYENIKYFERFVNPDFKIKYLILVTNIIGDNKLNIYAYVEPGKNLH